MDVAIDDPGLIENLSNELNYRLALTLNQLTLNTADTANAVDSSVNIQLNAGTFVTAGAIRSAIQSLAAVNARPLTPDGFWGGLIHPTVVRDVLNDTAANGLTDILKRNESTVDKLFNPLPNDEVIEFAGCKFKQTTTVGTTTISSATYYKTYIFGDDAIFSVFLGPNPQTGERNYRLMIQVAPSQGSVSDPARVIGGWVSYNVRFTDTLRPGSTMTLREILAEVAAS